MKNWNYVLLSFLFLSSQYAFSYGNGVSSHPLLNKQKLISAEATGIWSGDGGVGMQFRYTQKLRNNLVLDGGAGFANGDRSNRLFVGADYEIFPDYQKQPRVSAKASFISADEDGDGPSRSNIVQIAPTVSKGFIAWGKEIYPYLSLPVGLNLETEDNKYEFTQRVSLGATGKLPFEGYEKLTANIEGSINLNNGYTGILFGVTYPLN